MSKCIVLSRTLACSGVLLNDSLDTALGKIDSKLCDVSASAIQYERLQSLVGTSGILTDGDDQVILDTHVVEKTVVIMKDGLELPTDMDDRKSYTVTYGDTSTTIVFNFDVQDDELYIIKYAYVQT